MYGKDVSKLVHIAIYFLKIRSLSTSDYLSM